MKEDIVKLENELKLLDDEPVLIEGSLLKPSQCYHFETDPVHILFNTNCPDTLKERLKAIVNRHFPGYESSTQQ